MFFQKKGASQGDLENYFGRQGAIGCRKDNLNVRDTLYGNNLIKFQYDVESIQGNARKAKRTPVSDVLLKIYK